MSKFCFLCTLVDPLGPLKYTSATVFAETKSVTKSRLHCSLKHKRMGLKVKATGGKLDKSCALNCEKMFGCNLCLLMNCKKCKYVK